MFSQLHYVQMAGWGSIYWNTLGVCHPLSNGFELKHDMLSGDEGVKIKSTTGRVWWQVTGRWPASDQFIAGSMVGTTGRVRSGRLSVQSVAVSREFDPNGYFLSGACK